MLCELLNKLFSFTWYILRILHGLAARLHTSCFKLPIIIWSVITLLYGSMLCGGYLVYMSIHTSSITSTWHIDVLVLLWLVAHLNGQVGWVSLYLLSSLLLLPCWWPIPFWTCMEGGSSPASQEGLGQLRGAAQLTTSQLSSAPLPSLVHHCNHHCTDCAGWKWRCQCKWQEDWQHCHCHCGLAGTCSKQE